jgi:hypothetical protein
MLDSRRRYTRLAIRCAAQMSDGRATRSLRTEDVSLRGFFLRMDTPLALRRLVELQLVLPTTDVALKTFGMTVHSVVPGNEFGKPPGVGIELYALDRVARSTWEDFIRQAAAEANFAGAHDSPPTSRTPAILPSMPRRFRRTTTVVKMRAKSVAELYVLHARDLTRGGLSVETDQELLLGAPIVIEVQHPETGETFLLDAIVRHRRGDLRGFGVEVCGVDERMKEAFLDFIRGGIYIDESEIILVDESAA